MHDTKDRRLVTLRDVVDTLFALTSYPMFQMLSSTERNPDAICAMIQPLCEHVLAGK